MYNARDHEQTKTDKDHLSTHRVFYRRRRTQRGVSASPKPETWPSTSARISTTRVRKHQTPPLHVSLLLLSLRTSMSHHISREKSHFAHLRNPTSWFRFLNIRGKSSEAKIKFYSLVLFCLPKYFLVRPTAMGLQKKNEQITVGHFCGKHAMGAKKKRMSQTFFVGLCFFCGHLRK